MELFHADGLDPDARASIIIYSKTLNALKHHRVKARETRDTVQAFLDALETYWAHLLDHLENHAVKELNDFLHAAFCRVAEFPPFIPDSTKAIPN